jgi:MFS family permease
MNKTNDELIVDGATSALAKESAQTKLEHAPSAAPGPLIEAQRKVRRYERNLNKARAALEKWREARAWMRTPASKRSRFGLDWMNFFMADVETGFGTFVAFYLAGLGWSKGSVGLALGAGQIAAVIGQIPGGALADGVSWKRGLAAIGILMVCGSALIFAISPLFPLVFTAEILHGLASGLIGPSIAAISLGLVGRKAMSSRTGRNYRFDAAGNALTAGAMGLIGSYFSTRIIFFAASALCLPALLALSQIRPTEIDYRRARNAALGNGATKLQSIFDIVKSRNLLLFTLCLILFQFADASLLPLVAQNLGADKGQPASLMTSGLIAVPQLVVVLLAPWVGYLSESVGRKPLLLAGFAVEAARAALLGLISNYTLLVLAQVLGGITSAIIGVMTVLVVTDLTTGTGRFNLTRGAVVTLSTIAASLSVAVSGFIFQGFGQFSTFAIFAGVAAAAAMVAWFFLPETKPAEYLD